MKKLETTDYVFTIISSFLLQLIGWILIIAAIITCYNEVSMPGLTAMKEALPAIIILFTSGFILLGVAGFVDATIEIAMNTRIIAEQAQKTDTNNDI